MAGPSGSDDAHTVFATTRDFVRRTALGATPTGLREEEPINKLAQRLAIPPSFGFDPGHGFQLVSQKSRRKCLSNPLILQCWKSVFLVAHKL